MKIAIFTQRMDGRATGTALYARRLVENLIELAKEAGDELFLAHREKSGDPIYQKAREILLPKLPLPRGAYFFSEALFLWKTRNDFDIIHYPEESIYPLFWLSRAKIIITAHSGVEGWRDFGILRRRWWLIWCTFRFFKNRISRVICDSYSTKNSLQNFFNIPENKLSVVYLGVDERFFSALPQKNASAPYLLAFGRIDPHKNIPRIIEAYYKVKTEHGIPHCLILGAKHWPPENKKVDNLINKLGLSGDISFLKFVRDEDLPALYKGADIMIFPSLHEGFGLPILEAQAAGTPVITSNLFAMPEIAGGPKAAHLIDPYSVDDIATGIWKILNDSAYKNLLTEQGLRNSTKFNWVKTAEETFKIYKLYV